MQVIKKNTEKKFEPLVIEMTIESEDELMALYNRLNAPSAVIERWLNTSANTSRISYSSLELFEILDDELDRRNIKR